MKKLLLFLLALLPMLANAQNYYAPSDIDVSWRVWNEKTVYDWLIDNGQKVDVAVNPAVKYKTNSVGSVTEVCLTYVKNNKILALTFSKSEGIRLFTENNVYTLRDYFLPLQSLMQQSWFEIDFEHIIFSSQLNWLIIPCGYNPYAGYNGIAVIFTPDSGLYDVYSDSVGDNSEHTFNLNGIEVNESAAKGQILIKTNGNKAVKVLNK